jgi:hypothetical protein
MINLRVFETKRVSSLLIFFNMAQQPQWFKASSLSRIYYHTQLDTSHSVGLLWKSDQLVAENSTWQHTTLITERNPCPRWDSNPQSQQTNGRRHTPEIARPLAPSCFELLVRNWFGRTRRNRKILNHWRLFHIRDSNWIPRHSTCEIVLPPWVNLHEVNL